MSTDKRVPAIPEIRVADPAAQRVLEALKALADTREGRNDPLDKAITLRDLVSLGLAEVIQNRNGRNVSTNVQPTITGGEDSDWASVPPPDVTAFSATGLFAKVLLNWDVPGYANHAYTEIWRDSIGDGEDVPLFNRDRAVLIDMVTNGPYTDVPESSFEPRTFYYWVRHVSTSSLLGNLSDAASAALATDPGYIISVLLGDNSPYNEGNPLLIEVPEATTVNGVDVPAGIYIKDLYVQNGTITNAKIANLAVDDAKISSMTVDKLTAGELQATRWIKVEGYIYSGKTSFGSTTPGWWIGKESGHARLNIGDGNRSLKWDSFTGELNIEGVLVVDGSITGGTITGSEFIVGTTGNIRGSKTSYADTQPGFWLGYDTGESRLNIGDATTHLKWENGQLIIRGVVDTSVLTANLITDSVLDSTNTLISPTYLLDPAGIPGLGGGMTVAAEGQPLDDPTSVPKKLCYPSLLVDNSAAPVESLVADYRTSWVGTPTTQELYTGPENAGGGFGNATQFLRVLSADSVAPYSYKLHPYDASAGYNPVRAAKSQVRLRLRITDQAKYYHLTLGSTGTEAPPHWGGVPYYAPGGAGVYAVPYPSERLMQVRVLRLAGQTFTYSDVVSLLELSGGPTVVAGNTYNFNNAGVAGPPLNSFTASNVFTNGLEVGEFTTTQDGWDVTYSYEGPGGEISVLAEKLVSYATLFDGFSGAAITSYFAIEMRLGANMRGPAAANEAYTWPHLYATLEVIADNRPFLTEEIIIP